MFQRTIQPNDIKVHYLVYNNLFEDSERVNTHYLGLLSIIAPSAEGSELRFFNQEDMYKYLEDHFSEIKSETSTFDWYQSAFFLKLENDSEIELAFICPYDHKFTYQDLDSLHDIPACTKCEFDENNLLADSSYFISLGA